jgi:CCR4-NOT transcription complex subunit 6
VALLEHRQTGARLIVANAHIFWDPVYKDVKLVQVAILMDEIAKVGDRFAKLPARRDLDVEPPTYTDGSKIPTIVCGDFNSIPDSGVYEYLSKGHLPKVNLPPTFLECDGI